MAILVWPGPLTLKELFDYSARHIATLLDEPDGQARLGRLQLLVHRGVSLRSDYAGILCLDDRLLFHLHALNKQLELICIDLQSTCVDTC